jgi:hypothetical protein
VWNGRRGAPGAVAPVRSPEPSERPGERQLYRPGSAAGALLSAVQCSAAAEGHGRGEGGDRP